VVKALRAKGVEVVAMVRNPQAAAKKLPFDVQIVRGDVYEFGSIARAAAGCDAIIVTAGATDILDPFGPFNTEYQARLRLHVSKCRSTAQGEAV
jgi:uncharacterized protein YbjT (DUF2867 family)